MRSRPQRDQGDLERRLRELEDRNRTLRRNADSFQGLLETAGDWLWEVGPDGSYTFVSDRVTEVLGYRPDELLGKTPVDLMLPPDAARLRGTFADLRGKRQAIQNLRYTARHRDGHPVVLETIGVPVLDERGALIGFRGVDRDVSVRVRSERALAASEERFRSIVQASPMGIHMYELTADDRLVFIGGNPAADRLLGVDHAQFVGLTIEEAFPAIVGTEVPDHYRAAARDGTSWVTEQIDYRDERIHGAFEVIAFQTSPGRMVAMFLDITARLQAEQERRRLEEQLRQALKMEAIGRLAGGVAHDFNNLLTGIRGYAELVLQDLAEDDPHHRDVMEILRAGQRASALTQHLLAFSRKQLIQPRIVDLNEIVAESRRLLGRIIGEDIDLRTELSPELGLVRVDPHQMEQILVNLAANARDAMPRGGVLTLTTETARLDEDFQARHEGCEPGRYAHLRVADTGQGMRQEVLDRIFEPFFTTKEVGSGTGLGLSTVYGIVKQNNGCIEVASRPGAGTVFHIYLPVVRGERERNDRTPAPRATTGQETVLLVEDEESVRLLTRRILRGRGYHVLAAHHGEDALALSETCPDSIALLLTDVVMPDMSGKELYERLRPARPDLRVLYMSGYSENVIGPRGVVENGTDFLQKPFTVEGLAAKVREILDRPAG